MKSPSHLIDICTPPPTETPFIVGHIGASGLREYHELQRIVDAVEIVRQKHNVHLLQIGATDIERDWLIKLPKIPHSAMPMILRNMDVFCTYFTAPRYSNNLMSTKGLEIASMGIPIITDKCYGYEQMLGSTYPYFAETPEEIADKITTLLNKKEKIKAGHYCKVRSKAYSIDVVSKQWKEVL
jgi:hypothetical protein